MSEAEFSPQVTALLARDDDALLGAAREVGR